MSLRPFAGLSRHPSIVGIGTWAIGGDDWGGTDQAAAISALQTALDEGITLIDTAPIYGHGLAEELVATAIAGRRDEIVLATKAGLVWHTTEGEFFFPGPRGPVHKFLGPASLRYELEQSLRRLGTEVIDLYQVHFPEETTPIEDTMATLLSLRDAGKIRAIGVSNLSRPQLQRYLAAGSVDAAQERFSMLDPSRARDLFPTCIAANVPVLAYSPLEMGLLTGKMGPAHTFAADDVRANSPRFSVGSRAKVAALLADLQPIADGHNASLAQLVIAWTARQPGIGHVLCGARNPRQAKENAGAGAVVLSESDLAVIDTIRAQHAIELPPVFG